MSDETMRQEYPDREQRVAVCGSQYDREQERDMSPNDQMLKAVKARRKRSELFNYGITTADRYVCRMQESIGLDACYRLAATSTVSFDDVMQKAARTLTYCNPEMEVVEKAVKRLPKGVELPKNTLMVFRHVLSSSNVDRDGDILRSQGAEVDPKMLLLFNHTPTLPIGKYLATAKQNSKHLVLYSAIVDMNELSHDAAVMVDNDMARFSHGFRVLDFEELKDKEGEQSGFDVKEFEVMEESMVSVPANVDANMEEVLLSLVEGGKLTSPLMKEYGKGVREATPLTIPGTSIEYREGRGDSYRELSCNSLQDLKVARDEGLIGGKKDDEDQFGAGGEEGRGGKESKTGSPEEADDDQDQEAKAADEEVTEDAKTKAANVKLHAAGHAQAKRLVKAGKVKKPGSWKAPSAGKQNAYIEEHGMPAFGKWHLGKRDGVDEDKKGAWAYPYTSDFANVDRQGLLYVRLF